MLVEDGQERRRRIIAYWWNVSLVTLQSGKLIEVAEESSKNFQR